MSINPFLATNHGVRFQDESIVARYHLRLPYPQEAFDNLLSLITDIPRTILDVGTGTGDIARRLVEQVELVDAVDVSAAMLARAQDLPQGKHPHLHWICGHIEDVELIPPYSLIVVSDSILWLNWEIVFPRFANLLTPGGYVALLERNELPVPWSQGLRDIISSYSTIQNYPTLHIEQALTESKLFRLQGTKDTAPINHWQSIPDYVASFHSRSSLSLDHMPPEDAANFDKRLYALVEPYSQRGRLELQTVAHIAWGKPKA